MNYEQGTMFTSSFRVHRSRFSCSLAAALPDGLFEHPETIEASIQEHELKIFWCD
jgi:hypothetical protein